MFTHNSHNPYYQQLNHAWAWHNWFQNNDYNKYNHYRHYNYQSHNQHNNNRIQKRSKRIKKKNKHLKASLRNDNRAAQIQEPPPREPENHTINTYSISTYSDFRDNPSPTPQPFYSIPYFLRINGPNGYHHQQSFGPSVNYFPLPDNEDDFKMIQQMITNKNFVLDSVERISNSLNESAYELKKNDKQLKGYVEEEYLFHGTKRAFVDDICLYNFNWRRCVNHKFGYGVNFSRNATYASWYSDSTYYKVMLIAKVLIGKSCQGNQDMILPEEGCDTSHKDSSGSVIVKYEDNEFLPVFKLYYHFEDRRRHYW